MKVLLVDDDDSIRHIIALSILNMHPEADVTEAATGSAAMSLVDNNHFDLVISDYSMPDGTGGSLYNYMQKIGVSTPFILFTSECFEQVKEFSTLGDEWRDQYYIQKPVSMNELSDKISRIYEKPNLSPSQIDESFKRVKTLYFLRYNRTLCDVYLKLSPAKLIKIISKDSLFESSDIEKYIKRGVTHLHVKNEDIVIFEKALDELPFLRLESDNSDTASNWRNTHRALKLMVEDYGISPLIVEEASSFADGIIERVSRNKELASLLDKNWDKENYLYDHSYLILVIAYGILKDLRPDRFLKKVNSLSLSAIFHDICHDSAELARIRDISSSSFKVLGMDDKKRYLKAVEDSKLLVQSSSFFDTETKGVVADHSDCLVGFANGQRNGAQSFGMLSRVFIMSHDFVDALYRINFDPKQKKLIMSELFEKYQLGEFKVVYDSLVSCHHNPMDVIF